jgi:hypothetical protein
LDMKKCSADIKMAMIVVINLVVTFSSCDWAGKCSALGDETSVDIRAQGVESNNAEYHTPLAGEQSQATFLGRNIIIPAQDRNHMISLTVGASVLLPKQGSMMALPVAALYLRRIEEEARTRGVVSIFINELEYDKRLDSFELIGHFENYTIPGGRTEVVENQEIKSTSLTWGSFLGSLGPGLRFPVSPFQVDNDFRLQLLGRVGYFYAERTDDTGPSVLMPPSTLLYGMRLRGRYDGIRRNLLELPHQGIAAGFDVDYLNRDKWRDLTPSQNGSARGDYLQASAYLVGAGGIPGLSERDRVLISLYSGKIGQSGADRFNAFRINGGPFPNEADDLARPHYSGILYDDVRTTAYAMGSLGYRREIAFFLYGTVVGSYLWADRATVQSVDQVVFKDKTGAAATISLDSAFLWNSELYLAYSWESGFIRGGKSGNGISFNWNKSF